jgi:hypothetical protein
MATFGTQIAAGEWFLDRRGGAVRAALRFLWSDTPFWGERPDDAGYVHGLVIDRSQAGEGSGGQVLGGAEDRTRQAGRRFLRLDCAADTERLRGHDRERGSVELGRREFRDWAGGAAGEAADLTGAWGRGPAPTFREREKPRRSKTSGVDPDLPGRADRQVRRARPCRRGCTRCTR